MAVIANNSEGSSVPPEIAHHLEMDDDYNAKCTPQSADYNSTSGRNIFRNKKFTKKRHESKTRRTDQLETYACCSDEDDHQARSATPRHQNTTTSSNVDLNLHQRSIPKMMVSINQTIQKMKINDNTQTLNNGGAATATIPNTQPTPERSVVTTPVEESVGTAGAAAEECNPAPPNVDFEMGGQSGPIQQRVSHCTSNNSSSCNLLTQAQGKRRRHRRKQQYKRMAVDVQSDKKAHQLKVPTSNSSEDSGIGKRKRNIIVNDNNNSSTTNNNNCANNASDSKTVPVASTSSQLPLLHPHWPLEPDSDAVMMDCDDMESSSMTKVDGGSEGLLVTEESGESDTQNDIESLSDHNQDADDEESDYYNNDSSTTSLSESSFTILNSSNKKFIPVHSREIRSGRRRLKNNSSLSSLENEELSRFLQSSLESSLKVCPASDKERQEFINVASVYSLSYEESHDSEERVWIQFTKTSKTKRSSDLMKVSTFPEATFTGCSSMPGSLFDCNFAPGDMKNGAVGGSSGGGGGGIGRNSDEERERNTMDATGCNMNRGGVSGASQLVNSKRIKKGC